MRCRRGLDNFPQIITRLAGIADRFATILDCADISFIAALLALRDQVIAPILAGVRSPRRGRKPAHWTTIDRDLRDLGCRQTGPDRAGGPPPRATWSSPDRRDVRGPGLDDGAARTGLAASRMARRGHSGGPPGAPSATAIRAGCPTGAPQ